MSVMSTSKLSQEEKPCLGRSRSHLTEQVVWWRVAVCKASVPAEEHASRVDVLVFMESEPAAERTFNSGF